MHEVLSMGLKSECLLMACAHRSGRVLSQAGRSDRA